MTDETDAWLFTACLLLLGAAVVIADRRACRRLDRLEQDTQFLRIVVTTADGRRAD